MALCGIDIHTLKKRQEDATLRLGLNTPQVAQLRFIQEQHLNVLEKQKVLARNIHDKLSVDEEIQRTNLASCNVAVKNSRKMGQPRYRHIMPPSEINVKDGYDVAVATVERLSAEQSALFESSVRIDKEERSRRGRINESIKSLEEWFERYGEPKRQSNSEDKYRSHIQKPRWKPNVGWSSASVLRKGNLIN